MALAACSGSHPTGSSSVAGVSRTASRLTRSPDVTPSPSPGGGVLPAPQPTPVACPLGKGTIDPVCSRGTAPTLLPLVESVIDQLAGQRPDVLDVNDTIGTGNYRVKDPDAYYAEVIKGLQARGLCAGIDILNLDAKELQVKNSNDFSEAYDIMVSSGYVRRGPGAYRATCSPAAFPIEASDVIDGIRVAFYGFACNPGVAAPPNSAGKLPMGCQGLLTATPKDKNNKDVDVRIHGSEIAWRFVQGDDMVRAEDDPHQAFNKVLYPLRLGQFGLCATVKGKEGCLDGEVVE